MTFLLARRTTSWCIGNLETTSYSGEYDDEDESSSSSLHYRNSYGSTSMGSRCVDDAHDVHDVAQRKPSGADEALAEATPHHATPDAARLDNCGRPHRGPGPPGEVGRRFLWGFGPRTAQRVRHAYERQFVAERARPGCLPLGLETTSGSGTC